MTNALARKLPSKGDGMMTTRNEWKREHKGRYVSRRSGWIIERALQSDGYDGKWLVINPVTNRVADSLKTLALAKKHYSDIRPESVTDRRALKNLTNWISTSNE